MVFEISRLLDIFRIVGRLMDAVYVVLIEALDFAVAGTVVSAGIGLGFSIGNVFLEVFGVESGGMRS